MSLRHRLTAAVPLVVLARRNLSRASARSILAVAAIVIGVVAVGGIGVGGEAFKQDQLEAYEGLGGTATVHPGFDAEDNTFSESEIDRMRQAMRGGVVLPVIEEFTPTVRTSDGEAIPTARVKGIEDPGEFYEPASGAFPDNWRRTVIIGARVADENDIEVGDRVSVRVAGEFDRSFRVAAVLEPRGFTDPLTADQTVFVPLAQFEDSEYDQAIVRVDPQTGSVDEAEGRLDAEFNTRENRIAVFPVQERREQVESSFETINQFLIAVGGISLLVAAVTIANTMLMSTIEREGEIGVFRAVGYPKGAVVRLLVTEATILGVVGAAVGAPLALGIGLVANEILVGDPLAFTATGLRYVGIGVGFGVATALVAGLYPAWKAANKRPVEALD